MSIKPTKLNDHLLEQILENDEDQQFSIIEHYGLTNNEVKLIVKEWYLKHFLQFSEGVIQDEFGNDLEELLDLDCQDVIDLQLSKISNNQINK